MTKILAANAAKDVLIVMLWDHTYPLKCFSIPAYLFSSGQGYHDMPLYTKYCYVLNCVLLLV